MHLYHYVKNNGLQVNRLVGLTFTSVKNVDNEEIIFTQDNGDIYTFYHLQDCCENVMVEDICGDLNDLIGLPLIEAEEVSRDVSEDYDKLNACESGTWTFYKFRTTKGCVTIRWLGKSNGCYSEKVNFSLDTNNEIIF